MTYKERDGFSVRSPDKAKRAALRMAGYLFDGTEKNKDLIHNRQQFVDRADRLIMILRDPYLFLQHTSTSRSQTQAEVVQLLSRFRTDFIKLDQKIRRTLPIQTPEAHNIKQPPKPSFFKKVVNRLFSGFTQPEAEASPKGTQPDVALSLSEQDQHLLTLLPVIQEIIDNLLKYHDQAYHRDPSDYTAEELATMARRGAGLPTDHLESKSRMYEIKNSIQNQNAKLAGGFESATKRLLLELQKFYHEGPYQGF